MSRVYPEGSALVAYCKCGCLGAALLVDAFTPEEIEKEVRSWRRDGMRERLELPPLPEMRLGVCCSEEHPKPRERRPYRPPSAPSSPATDAEVPDGDY